RRPPPSGGGIVGPLGTLRESAARAGARRRPTSEEEMAQEFIVQLDNRPGALASLAQALADRGVDLRAIGGGGIGEAGHVIMTTADDDACREVLRAGGYT